MPDVYRALGDSTRRRILSMLKQGNKTQKEIVEAFDISQPAIKKHLDILLGESIIKCTPTSIKKVVGIYQKEVRSDQNQLGLSDHHCRFV